MAEDSLEAHSLQAAFMRWKHQREVHKGQQPVKAKLPSARKQELRALIVTLARSFIGVPYARRAHQVPDCACEGCQQAGRQLGCEPLFLDCCGLVRKVFRRALGLKMGPGNQAYQFDTLPTRVSSAAELEPGDLVFYSGIPFDSTAKRHKFDMMHVEIFVGGNSGEATIGSRERFKWVMEYDSYRFESKRWALSAHHFCKVDTWLEGVVEAQHPELWMPAGGFLVHAAYGRHAGCDGGSPSTATMTCSQAVQQGQEEGEAADLQ